MTENNEIKSTNVIGLHIVTLDDGKKIGKVHDIIFDPVQNKVRALLLDEGGWFSSSKIIAIEDVKSIGADAVIIDNEEVIKKASEVSERVESITKDNNYLTKSKVLTEEGTELGIVTDMLFVLPDGRVTQLEVSEGLLKSLQSGKKYIAFKDIITVGEDRIIVKAFTEDKLDEQGKSQGLSGFVHSTGENTSNLIDKAKEGLGQATETVKAKTSEGVEAIKTKAPETINSIQEAAANLGGKAKDMAITAKDTIQSKAEELNNHPKVVAAKEAALNKLEETKAYVQSGQASDDATSTVQEKAEEIKSNIQDKAKSVASYVEAKTQQTQQTFTQSRIDSAVGKYLTVTVLGYDPILKKDHILGNINELITHGMIEKAQKYDVLDKVLKNTSDTPLKMEM